MHRHFVTWLFTNLMRLSMTRSTWAKIQTCSPQGASETPMAHGSWLLQLQTAKFLGAFLRAHSGRNYIRSSPQASWNQQSCLCCLNHLTRWLKKVWSQATNAGNRWRSYLQAKSQPSQPPVSWNQFGDSSATPTLPRWLFFRWRWFSARRSGLEVVGPPKADLVSRSPDRLTGNKQQGAARLFSATQKLWENMEFWWDVFVIIHASLLHYYIKLLSHNGF